MLVSAELEAISYIKNYGSILWSTYALFILGNTPILEVQCAFK